MPIQNFKQFKNVIKNRYSSFYNEKVVTIDGWGNYIKAVTAQMLYILLLYLVGISLIPISDVVLKHAALG